MGLCMGSVWPASLWSVWHSTWSDKTAGLLNKLLKCTGIKVNFTSRRAGGIALGQIGGELRSVVYTHTHTQTHTHTHTHRDSRDFSASWNKWKNMSWIRAGNLVSDRPCQAWVPSSVSYHLHNLENVLNLYKPQFPQPWKWEIIIVLTSLNYYEEQIRQCF